MKQIRKLFFILLTPSLMYSCGEAGVGFDVGAELPIDVGTMFIDIPGTGLPTNIDPESIEFDYNLSDVDGFEDAVDELNSAGAEIFLNGVSYEFSGVNEQGESYNENVPIESIRIEFTGIGTPLEINFPGGVLDNISKTSVDISGVKSAIESALLNNRGVGASFIFDMGEITSPSSNEQIDFDVRIYFDAAIRVRDIAN